MSPCWYCPYESKLAVNFITINNWQIFPNTAQIDLMLNQLNHETSDKINHKPGYNRTKHPNNQIISITSSQTTTTFLQNTKLSLIPKLSISYKKTRPRGILKISTNQVYYVKSTIIHITCRLTSPSGSSKFTKPLN